jgi:seryl-tRNA synthetase
VLNIELIRNTPDVVKKAARDKGITVDIDQLLTYDEQRRQLQRDADALRAKRNSLSDAIPKLSGDEKQNAIAESKQLGPTLKALEEQLQGVEAQLRALMLLVPSPPAPEVPVGKGEEDNLEIRRVGEPRKFEFTPKDHVELALSLGLVDFDRPRKFAGARSFALIGDGVLLELAALRFALDHVVGKGFVPVAPPVMVKEVAMEGTGFFPLFREEAYHIEKDGLFLTGTSEVALVSMHRDEVLSEAELPIRLAGISACFRREAGAAGRDTRGLYRVHMFQKVEQVILCAADPEASLREHLLLLANSEEILQKLGLPYRVALACTAELGLGQIRKHEVESWMPSRNAYAETHSCSTLSDFQARRSNIRYQGPSGKPQFVHTLNNTAIASPRILIPILENYQQADGSVVIPEVLRPYLGGRERLVPRR